jgi:DNA repair exonuclease SbcCD ATPase subunit
MLKRWLNFSKRSPRAWGIAKAMDMLGSPHLAGMSAEAKRCALLMALDAAGTGVESLIQDAVMQQRLLDQQEEALEAKLRRFEAAKLEQNRAVQAELDRLSSRHLQRLQANLDAIARQQDEFRAWQKGKEQEAQRMTDAAAFCVPRGHTSRSATLSVVMEPIRARG